MCGIASIVSKTDNETTIESMLDIMKHRGRDCTSILTTKHNDRNVYLGHNRLSINDVSTKGNQPMVHNDLGLIVNGEIWNYKELRKEYETRGYEFFSNSDSNNSLSLCRK